MLRPASTGGRLSIFCGILAVLALSLPACAKRSTTQPKSDQATVAAAERELASLEAAIEGTRADRLAGELIVYHRLQDGLVACMAQQGFLYEPHTFVDPTLGLSDPIVPHTEWLDPLTTDFGLLTQSKAMAEGIAAQAKADNVTTVYETLAPKDHAKYRDAMSGACHDGDDTGFQNANFPDGFYSLEGEL